MTQEELAQRNRDTIDSVRGKRNYKGAFSPQRVGLPYDEERVKRFLANKPVEVKDKKLVPYKGPLEASKIKEQPNYIPEVIPKDMPECEGVLKL